MYLNIIHEDNADILEIQSERIGQEVINGIETQVNPLIAKNRSIVLDFAKVIALEPLAYDWLLQFHDKMYQQHNLSFVICGWQVESETDVQLDMLNLTPTRIEALDIVNMEVIERELLAEDDEPASEA